MTQAYAPVPRGDAGCSKEETGRRRRVEKQHDDGCNATAPHVPRGWAPFSNRRHHDPRAHRFRELSCDAVQNTTIAARRNPQVQLMGPGSPAHSAPPTRSQLEPVLFTRGAMERLCGLRKGRGLLFLGLAPITGSGSPCIGRSQTEREVRNQNLAGKCSTRRVSSGANA
jgi:hypothetical protein